MKAIKVGFVIISGCVWLSLFLSGCERSRSSTENSRQESITKALKLLDQGRAKEAALIFEELHEGDPTDDEISVGLASAYAAMAGLKITSYYDLFAEALFHRPLMGIAEKSGTQKYRSILGARPKTTPPQFEPSKAHPVSDQSANNNQAQTQPQPQPNTQSQTQAQNQNQNQTPIQTPIQTDRNGPEQTSPIQYAKKAATEIAVEQLRDGAILCLGLGELFDKFPSIPEDEEMFVEEAVQLLDNLVKPQRAHHGFRALLRATQFKGDVRRRFLGASNLSKVIPVCGDSSFSVSETLEHLVALDERLALLLKDIGQAYPKEKAPLKKVRDQIHESVLSLQQTIQSQGLLSFQQSISMYLGGTTIEGCSSL